MEGFGVMVAEVTEVLAVAAVEVVDLVVMEVVVEEEEEAEEEAEEDKKNDVWVHDGADLLDTCFIALCLSRKAHVSSSKAMKLFVFGPWDIFHSLQVGDLPLGYLTNFSCSRRKNNPPWCLFAVGSCMRCESVIYHVEAFVSCLVGFILLREALHHIVHHLHHDSHIGSRLGCSCVCGNHGTYAMAVKPKALGGPTVAPLATTIFTSTVPRVPLPSSACIMHITSSG
ncbi:hypothetical protein DY000_02035533 [Brassica cretica]|uniref:Uncharacterized protein n=1 Tax=Brassica cretica TaxID=69181 RepID=A0ABQ7DMV6_BRACR|nr:hypothetical protein DY000_02035533 [Brassica cretica]